jgi:hypothetical protein
MDKALHADVFTLPADRAWPRVFDWAWSVCAAPIDAASVPSILGERERRLAPLDNLLAGSAWDLWDGFEAHAPRTSAALATFWAGTPGGKAILILDALSLREVPWLLEQAQARGFTIHTARATASELPAQTTPFAKAIGFAQRSALAHNAGKSPIFPGALTETSDLPFADCKALVPPHPGIVFWHTWPDERMHKLAEDSGGFRTLAKEAAQTLVGDDFWALVATLATGRRLVVTSDHGYANVGLFPDVEGTDHGKAPTQSQGQALKGVFKSGRSAPADDATAAGLAHWAPPLTRRLTTAHGDWLLVLGRKKWKSQGGYPTLAHGGLTLLEVAVPYIELSAG